MIRKQEVLWIVIVQGSWVKDCDNHQPPSLSPNSRDTILIVTIAHTGSDSWSRNYKPPSEGTTYCVCTLSAGSWKIYSIVQSVVIPNGLRPAVPLNRGGKRRICAGHSSACLSSRCLGGRGRLILVSSRSALNCELGIFNRALLPLHSFLVSVLYSQSFPHKPWFTLSNLVPCQLCL